MKRIQINAIAKAVEYFEANLQEEVTIAEAAELTGYSLYHFCRLFNAITRYSPFHYLIKRRICEAARELLNTNKNISRIAFEYEFNSPETFSRAFRRILGMLPLVWRKTNHVILENKLMPAFSRDFLKFINQENFPEPTVEDQPLIKLSGLMGTDKKELLRQFANEPEYHISWISNSSQQKFHFAGFLKDGSDNPDFVQKVLPAGKWVSFEYPELNDNLNFIRTFLYNIWLVKFDYRLGSSLEVLVTKAKKRSGKFWIPVSPENK